MINIFIICNFNILLKLLGQHLSSFDDIRVLEMISLEKIGQVDSLKKTALAHKPDAILFVSGT